MLLSGTFPLSWEDMSPRGHVCCTNEAPTELPVTSSCLFGLLVAKWGLQCPCSELKGTHLVCLCVSSACLGALLFLPLVDFQLSECLESLRSSSSSSCPASAAALTSVAPREQPQRQQPGFSVEDVALAALRLLHLLVSHSHEVITAKNTPFPLWPSQKSQLVGERRTRVRGQSGFGGEEGGP